MREALLEDVNENCHKVLFNVSNLRVLFSVHKITYLNTKSDMLI